MSSAGMNQIVVVGGSIAATTAAQALRVQGFEGAITLLSDESHPPYSRVPLSKGVLAGRETPESAWLPALADDVAVRLNATVARLHPERRCVELSDGDDVRYDGLVIATGARARRLARPGQRGERVVRTVDDAVELAGTLQGARSAIVIRAGFLGMEVASTCRGLGLDVTIIDRDPPLRRLLGPWLAEMVTAAARDAGVRFVQALDGVALQGDPEIGAVLCGDQVLCADVVVSAVGDLPNVEWLADSGLPVNGGLVVDERCRVAPHIVAAGDVTATRLHGELYRRSPHWTNAVQQGATAAAALIHGDSATPPVFDPYYWTEQFGLDVKISGEIPQDAPPTVLAGAVRERSVLLQWQREGRPVASASVNHRMPIVKLKRLGAHAPA